MIFHIKRFQMYILNLNLIEHFIVEQDFNELYRIHNIENIHIYYSYD